MHAGRSNVMTGVARGWPTRVERSAYPIEIRPNRAATFGWSKSAAGRRAKRILHGAPLEHHVEDVDAEPEVATAGVR